MIAIISGIASVPASAIKDIQNKTPASGGKYFRNAFKAAMTLGAAVQPVKYLYSVRAGKNTTSFSFNDFGDHYDLLKVIFFLIPRIPNRLMVALLHGASLPGRLIRQKGDHADDRDNPLLNEKGCSFFTADKFIENQNDWEAVRFGMTDMRYAGCEIIAVYNALLSLGKNMSGQDMSELIRYFERKGAVAFGYGGTSPASVIRYFAGAGYKVNTIFSRNTAKINKAGEDSDTVIITAYNDKYDVSEMIHTVSVTRDKDGNFALHNGYKYAGNKAVALDQVNGKPIKSLQEILEYMSDDGNARAICVIGINKQEENT